MAVADDIRKCVFFIGHGDEEHFKSCGTAFMLEHDGSAYLVTARHVVTQALRNDPFSIRINRTDGTSDTFQHDPLTGNPPWFKWYFPEDPTVDLAAIPFNVPARTMGLDMKALKGSAWVLDQVRFLEEGIGLGDTCHAVGLFRVMQGTRRNVPVIHTGNIALVAGEERIDVKDWNHDDKRRRLLINAHLVEMANLDGLSGAPVFVRGSLQINDMGGHDVIVTDTHMHLLGVWHGSWDQEMPSAAYGERIPVGMGIVVPASDLLALLNQTDVVQDRNRFLHEVALQQLPSLDAKKTSSPDA